MYYRCIILFSFQFSLRVVSLLAITRFCCSILLNTTFIQGHPPHRRSTFTLFADLSLVFVVSVGANWTEHWII